VVSIKNYERRYNFEIDLNRIILKLRGAQIILFITIGGRGYFCISYTFDISKRFLVPKRRQRFKNGESLRYIITSLKVKNYVIWLHLIRTNLFRFL